MTKILTIFFAFCLAITSTCSYADETTPSPTAVEIDKAVEKFKKEAMERAALDAATCGTWSWGCDNDWDISVSIPAIKLRQGEKAKLFEGIAAGVQLNNLFGKTHNSLASGIILTPAFMLATTDAIDASGNRNSDYVLSFALLFGVKKEGGNSFQIGYAYDLMSSHPADVFKKAKKGSVLFNVGTTY